MVGSENEFIEQVMDADYDLDIFEMIARTNEPSKEIVKRELLSIIGSQIETKRIFSLVGILTNLKRCHLQSKNSKKSIFVNINWPNDPKSGCKSPFNFIEIIGINANL
jgi:hypothetical protein